MALRYFVLVIFLFLITTDLSECRRGGGSARRVPTRSPASRRTTYRSPQRVTTPRYNVQTQKSYPNYNEPSYNRPNAAQKVTTPRYNVQTHSNYPVNQPGYNRPPYNAPPNYQPGYNQPTYNHPSSYQPGYNQPHLGQSGYYPQRFSNNQYSPTMWQPKKDHSVRNSVIAGLGGSALGVFLGYQMANMLSSPSRQNYVGGDGVAYPPYSVVHYYHQGDKPIVGNSKIEEGEMKSCDNITLCPTGTTPLCATNNTVYCVASLSTTSKCVINSTELTCINSNVTVPCDSNSTNCNSTSLNNTTLQIPCVSTVDVFGDFKTGKLSINKVAKREAENVTVIENVTTDINNLTLTNDTSSTGAPPVSMSQTASDILASSLSSQGISNKFCVTVIANPVPEAVVPPRMNNEDFIKYLNTNPEMKEEANRKAADILNSIGNFIF